VIRWEASGKLGPVSILICDDFEPWRRTISAILAEDADLEIVGECSDGPEAVQMAAELQPDLVVLDIMLPTMNGLEAGRLILAASPGIKILFVSTHRSTEMIREAVRIGAGFIAKSDAGRDLLPMIRAVLGNEPFVRFRVLEDDPANSGEM
jgi:DNA-binding NarL/FixJ family response regulator